MKLGQWAAIIKHLNVGVVFELIRTWGRTVMTIATWVHSRSIQRRLLLLGARLVLLANGIKVKH